MYSSTLSLTSELDGGGWSTPRPGRYTPGKETRYPLYRRPDGPQGRAVQVRKISPTPGFDPRTVMPVANRHTDWALPAPIFISSISILYFLSRQDLQTLYLSFTFSYRNAAYILLISRTVLTLFSWIDTLVKGESDDVQDSVHAEQCVQNWINTNWCSAYVWNTSL
jgi:hypothetical protein